MMNSDNLEVTFPSFNKGKYKYLDLIKCSLIMSLCFSVYVFGIILKWWFSLQFVVLLYREEYRNTI